MWWHVKDGLTCERWVNTTKLSDTKTPHLRVAGFLIEAKTFTDLFYSLMAKNHRRCKHVQFEKKSHLNFHLKWMENGSHQKKPNLFHRCFPWPRSLMGYNSKFLGLSASGPLRHRRTYLKNPPITWCHGHTWSQQIQQCRQGNITYYWKYFCRLKW